MLILSTPQGAAAEGRGPCYVHYISMSGRGGQINEIYHDLEFKAKYLQYRGLVKLGRIEYVTVRLCESHTAGLT